MGQHAARRKVSRIKRLANDAFTSILRPILHSPLHRLASNRFLILAFTGRTSGKPYSLVVAYWPQRDHIDVLCLTAWWKNLAVPGARARVLFRGQWAEVTPKVHHGDETVIAVYRRVLEQSPAMRRMVDLDRPPSALPDGELREAVAGTSVIRLPRPQEA